MLNNPQPQRTHQLSACCAWTKARMTVFGNPPCGPGVVLLSALQCPSSAAYPCGILSSMCVRRCGVGGVRDCSALQVQVQVQKLPLWGKPTDAH